MSHNGRSSLHKVPIPTSASAERFSMSSGPVKILMRDGKRLAEPEIVIPKPEEPMDTFSLRRRRMGG